MTTRGDSVDWSRLSNAIRSSLSQHAIRVRHDIDDAIQEALLTVWLRLLSGDVPRDLQAYATRVAHRRIVDAWRRHQREPTRSCVDSEASCDPEAIDNWVELLEGQGAKATEAGEAVLRLITKGLRSSKALALALERNVKTIKERRARLCVWLRRLAEDWDVPPPSDD